MKRTLLLATIAAGTLSAQTPDIAGDWQGVLKVGADQIHLTLHISVADKGAWKATMDSAEQGAMGLQVTTVTFKDSKLSLAMESIHGTYEGNVNAAATAIDGTWSQGQPMPLKFTRAPKPTGDIVPSDIAGVWQGAVQIGGRPLPLVFHIASTPAGLAATMDSPDQGATGLPVTSTIRDGYNLTMQLASLGAKFQGTIAKDLSSIAGTFTQGGASLPLSLTRGSDAK